MGKGRAPHGTPQPAWGLGWEPALDVWRTSSRLSGCQLQRGCCGWAQVALGSQQDGQGHQEELPTITMETLHVWF